MRARAVIVPNGRKCELHSAVTVRARLDRSSCRQSVACVLMLIVALVGALSAQRGFGRRFRLPEGEGSFPPRRPPVDFEDGTFMICKLQYTSVRSEFMGIGWSTDYPYAGINLMIRLSELTLTPVTKNEKDEPNYWVVRLTDDALFRCPFLMASDVPAVRRTEVRVPRPVHGP